MAPTGTPHIKRVVGDHPDPASCGRIEGDDFLLPALRDKPQDLGREVAVRIDQRQAVAGPKIRSDQRPQKGRLTHAGLADKIHVVPAIPAFDSKVLTPAPKLGLSEEGPLLIVW